MKIVSISTVALGLFASSVAADTLRFLKSAPTPCGDSECDADMYLANNNVDNLVFHIPVNSVNTATLAANPWPTDTFANQVNSPKVTTNFLTNGANPTKSAVKYGGFCAASQKVSSYIGSIVVPTTIANPSWIAACPAADLLDGIVGGELKAGGSYRIPVTFGDAVNINAAASFCKGECKKAAGCKYIEYGWEDGSYFCKLHKIGVCDAPGGLYYWRPSPPIHSVENRGGAAPITLHYGGGCRITDTIPANSTLLTAGSWKVDPNTPYTESLPYASAPANPTPATVIGAIRCDVLDGTLTIGWPVYGVSWV